MAAGNAAAACSIEGGGKAAEAANAAEAAAEEAGVLPCERT